MNKKTVVVDIDGTLANCEHRRHYVQTQPKDWDTFFALAPLDSPIVPIVELVSSIRHRYRIVFCTGRGFAYVRPTLEWLVRHLGLECAAPGALLMRSAGDRRDDPVVKPELLAAAGLTVDNVAFILEDRSRIVHRWRELGFTCLQVAEGDF